MHASKRQKFDEPFVDSKREVFPTSTALPKTDVSYPLEWKFNTNENEFMDTNMYLVIGARIVKADGSGIDGSLIEDTTKAVSADGEKPKKLKYNVGVINFLMLTMFQSIEFQINGVN